MAAERERQGIQPSLFQPEAFNAKTRCSEVVHNSASSVPLSGRTRRLFSLTHRANLCGSHERRLSSEAGKRYAASIVVSRPAGPGGLGLISRATSVATVSIGELPRLERGALLLVNHYKVSIGGPDAIVSLIADLSHTWRCKVTLAEDGDAAAGLGLNAVPEARASLAETLMVAAADGAVQVYVRDGSQEHRDFDGQVVRAQLRRDSTGRLVVETGSRDDAYVLGLGVLLQAAGFGAPAVRRAA